MVLANSKHLRWLPFSLIFFLILNLFFNWRIIALQSCVGFCQPSTWISHRHMYVPPCWISLPPPPLASPLGCYRAGVWVPWVKQQIPVGYLFYIWQRKFPCYSLHIAWILRGTISSMSPNSGNVPLEGFCYHFETRANNSWQWNSSPRPGILPLKNQFSSVA